MDIIIVWILSKKVYAIARDKGHSGVPYVILFIVLWFGGEVAGALFSMILSQNTEPDVGTYVMALAGAAFGAGIGFIIVHMIPSLHVDDDRDRWDDDVRRDDDRFDRDDDYRCRDDNQPKDGIREGRPSALGHDREDDESFREGRPRRGPQDS